MPAQFVYQSFAFAAFRPGVGCNILLKQIWKIPD